MQDSQGQATQQEELARQLQERLNSIQNQVIDLKVFQDQSLEVHTKIKAEQQRLISKVEIIHNYFQEVRNAFDNIIFKEKEAKATRATLQKAVVLKMKEYLKLQSFLSQSRLEAISCSRYGKTT